MQKTFPFILLLLLIMFLKELNGQNISVQDWRGMLNKPFDKIHSAVEIAWDSLQQKPAEQISTIISTLQNNENITASETVQIDLLKVKYYRKKTPAFQQGNWKYWGKKAMDNAMLQQDDYLIQSCCLELGDAYLAGNNYDTAIFYLLKSAELADKIGYDEKIIFGIKISVSNALYRTRNYIQCIQFCANVAAIQKQTIPIAIITAYNNAGLSYLRLQQLDSAIYFFTKGATYAHKIEWGIWEGILLGNIGDAIFAKGAVDKAMPYWHQDFDSCIKYGELQNAGLTLAFISQYEFSHGQPQKAIRQLHWAEAINKTDAINLLRIFKIKGDIYRKSGWHDSADYFFQQHYRLNDSFNLVVNRNNYTTVQLKLNYEQNNHDLQVLKNQRLVEINKRNFLLIALLASLAIALLLYNRQKLKIKLALQQKEIAEAEKKSAKEQLEVFTQVLLDKNEQIDLLHTSLQKQHTLNTDELIHQTLLTDFDWNRFKDLFEKPYPDFFNRLKNAAPGVTQSELRLAALIKLNLDNKQMASMQGISVSSVRGNKTRLRQKLSISADTDLEELIKQL